MTASSHTHKALYISFWEGGHKSLHKNFSPWCPLHFAWWNKSLMHLYHNSIWLQQCPLPCPSACTSSYAHIIRTCGETTGFKNCEKYSWSTFCTIHYLNRYCVRDTGRYSLLHITPQHYGKHNRNRVRNKHCSSHDNFAVNKWKCNVWTHKQRGSAVTYDHLLYHSGGTPWGSWLRHWATDWKVTGSILYAVTGIFHWHNPSGPTVALGLTQPLT